MAVCQCPRSFVTSFGIIPNFWAVLVTKRAMRPEHGRMGLAVFWVHAGLATARPGRRGRALTMAVVRAPTWPPKWPHRQAFEFTTMASAAASACHLQWQGAQPGGGPAFKLGELHYRRGRGGLGSLPTADPGHGAEGQAASKSQGPLAP